MNLTGHLIREVKDQLPNTIPDYTDPEADLQYVEITRVTQEQLADIESGFRYLAHKNMVSPIKDGERVGCVLVDDEPQEGTEKLSHVGRFFDANGSHVVVYKAADGFRMAEIGVEKREYNHTFHNGESLHDGKLWKRRVMQLILKIGEEYSVGLLLTEAQVNVAKKALQTYQTSTYTRVQRVLGEFTPKMPTKADTLLALCSIAVGFFLH